jgi:small-conductance mechanosensitive channel
MNKDELEKQVETLTKELENKKHLDDAVKAKDKEISALKERNEELDRKLGSQVHLGDAVKAKDKEINELKQHVEVLKDNVRILESKKDSQLREAIAKSKQESEVDIEVKYQELKKTYEEEKKKLVEENKFLRTLLQRREAEVGKLANAHGDLLKTLEASVNTHLTLNAYLINEIQGK